jgi:uncharacterized protein (TIGR02466 family)
MKSNFFASSIYIKENISFLEKLNNASDKYIEEAIKINKDKFKDQSDFGLVHHSSSLIHDNDFLEFSKFISQNAYSILDEQGYNLNDYVMYITEMWVQQFAKNGGGHHSPHTHWNGHISGFYFLKCSDKTSYPIFHDPRPSKVMNQLPEKDVNSFSDAVDLINFKPKPGTFVFFNSYLGHEFVVDHGIEPFRFIHFNIRAVPKQLINNDIKRISS